MGVFLVLHALDKHPLDNLHIMLLLVAEDPWKVPKEDETRNFESPVRMSEINKKKLWNEASRNPPEYVQGRFSQGNAVRVDRVKEKLEHLWPLIIPIIIWMKGRKKRKTNC